MTQSDLPQGVAITIHQPQPAPRIIVPARWAIAIAIDNHGREHDVEVLVPPVVMPSA